jgi:hypothetical protein
LFSIKRGAGRGDQVRGLSHAVASPTSQIRLTLPCYCTYPGKYTTATNGPLPQSGPPSPLRPVKRLLDLATRRLQPCRCSCLLPMSTSANGGRCHRQRWQGTRTSVAYISCVRTYSSTTEHIMTQRHTLGLAEALYLWP